MSGGPNLTFAITAVDQVEAQVAKINKALFGIGKTAKQVSEGPGGVSGIGVNARAVGVVVRELGELGSRALERFGKAAEGVGTKLGAFSPALAGLTSITTLAGLGEVTRRAAEFGASITRTSAQVGVSQTDLQKWNAVMFRVGFTAENTASMLGNVNKASLEARVGLNPQTWGIAQLEHINISGDTSKTILSIADAIKKMHAEGQNAETEGQVLDAFGISRDHIALFEQGSAAIQKLLDQRGASSRLSDKEIGQLSDLDQSFRGVGQSATDFGNAIAAGVSGPIIKANEGIAQWLDGMRQVPGVMKGVEGAVTVLSAILTGGLVIKVGQLAARVTGLTWALRGLFTLPAIPAWLAALWGLGGAAAHDLGDEASQTMTFGNFDTPGGLPGMPGVGETGRALGQPWGMDWWRRLKGGARGSNTSGGGSPTGFDAGDMGAAQYAIDQIESRGGTSYNNAPYPGHSATGRRQIIPSTWAMYAKPGERIDNEADNVAVSNRIIADLWDKYHDWDKVAYSYANGSPGSPDRNPGYVDQFRKHVAEYNSRMASTGAGRPAFPPGLVKYNSHGQPYAASLDHLTAEEKANVAASTKAGFPSQVPDWLQSYESNLGVGGSSSHEVTIHIASAPPGTQAAVTGAKGPASVNLRTSYSMGDVW